MKTFIHVVELLGARNTFTNNGVQANFDQDGAANLTFTAAAPMTGGHPAGRQRVPVVAVDRRHLVRTIQNNFMGTSTAHSASTQGGGLCVEIQGHTAATILIDSNVIKGYDADY